MANKWGIPLVVKTLTVCTERDAAEVEAEVKQVIADAVNAYGAAHDGLVESVVVERQAPIRRTAC